MSRIIEKFPPNLMSPAGDCFFLTNAEGEILEYNENFLALITKPLESSVLGSSLKKIFPPDTAHFFLEGGNKVLLEKKMTYFEKKKLSFQGEFSRFYSIRLVPLYHARGVSTILCLLLERSTAYKDCKINSPEMQARTKEEGSTQRSFLARMSHEIRTPMNGIMGMTDLALQSNPSKVIGEYLDVIKKAADSLLNVINNILDFTKIELGRIELEKRPIDLALYLNDIIALQHPRAKEKGLIITKKIDSKLPPVLLGDPTCLRQILTNLMANAIKFTEKGSIVLRLEMGEKSLPKDKNILILCASIKDTGIGVKKENLGHLFEPFTQSDVSINRRYGGTGLGLAISQHLAQRMGGDLTVKSAFGVGTEFFLNIPLEIPSEDKVDRVKTGVRGDENDKPSFHWDSQPVLLVEDNRVNQKITANLLTHVGFKVVICSDGCDALDLWEEVKPVLILMDLQMPTMDGITTTKVIREKERTRQLLPIPIIALTAYVLEEERLAAMAAGMNAWVSKPIRPDELYTKILDLIPGSSKKNQR